jgi:hypothetical protein
VIFPSTKSPADRADLFFSPPAFVAGGVLVLPIQKMLVSLSVKLSILPNLCLSIENSNSHFTQLNQCFSAFLPGKWPEEWPFEQGLIALS